MTSGRNFLEDARCALRVRLSEDPEDSTPDEEDLALLYCSRAREWLEIVERDVADLRASLVAKESELVRRAKARAERTASGA